MAYNSFFENMRNPRKWESSVIKEDSKREKVPEHIEITDPILVKYIEGEEQRKRRKRVMERIIHVALYPYRLVRGISRWSRAERYAFYAFLLSLLDYLRGCG